MSTRLLLVDDEAAIRELHTLYFQMQGFSIVTASNAIDALQEVYSHQFDIVILDLSLGDSNGINLIEPIKAAQPHAPIFIYTANEYDEIVRQEAFKLGASRFLSKSCPLDYIAMEIRRVLASKAAPVQNSPAPSA